MGETIHVFNTKLKTNNYDIKVYTTGIQKPMVNLHTLFAKTHYVFEYIISGKGSFIIDGKLHSVQKGDLLFIPPNVPVKLLSNSKEPYSAYYLEFYSSSMNKVFEQIGFNDDKYLIHLDDKKILSYFKKIFSLSKNNSLCGMLSTIGTFFSFLSYLVSKNTSNILKQVSPIDVYVSKAVWFIETYYRNEITIVDIANHVALSRHYLTRIFTQKLQISPTSYLLNFRISQAKNLLIKSQNSITNISIDCGFNSSSNFAMQFKRIVGITPTEYRKKHSTI